MRKNNKKIELRKEENQDNKDSNNWLPIGMCIGLCLGTVIGVATDNIGLWLPIGLCLGVSLGAAFSDDKDNNKKK